MAKLNIILFNCNFNFIYLNPSRNRKSNYFDHLNILKFVFKLFSKKRSINFVNLFIPTVNEFNLKVLQKVKINIDFERKQNIKKVKTN